MAEVDDLRLLAALVQAAREPDAGLCGLIGGARWSSIAAEIESLRSSLAAAERELGEARTWHDAEQARARAELDRAYTHQAQMQKYHESVCAALDVIHAYNAALLDLRADAKALRALLEDAYNAF